MAEQTPNRPWLSVIGMGADGLNSLSAKARTALDSADVLVSSPRLFALIPQDERPRIEWSSPFSATLPAIEACRAQNVAIIATGDPLCYGVGNWLLTKFPIEEMTIFPGISAFALTCARMGWPQHKAVLHTLHGRDDRTIRDAIAPGAKLVVLSADAKTPKTICTHLVKLGYKNATISVLSHLDGSKENRIDGVAKDSESLFDAAFEANPDNDLNTVAIHCVAGTNARILSRAPGLSDHHFSKFRKMTKSELRSLALSRLAPQPGDIMWDVGAGSASVAVEFLRLAPGGAAYTFDIDEDAKEHQRENAARFGLTNLYAASHGELPLQDHDLNCPKPDAIFMGGGISKDRIEAALRFLKPGGRFVCNSVTIESEADLLSAYGEHGGELSRISIARAEPLGAVHGFKPAMPITQWFWQKENKA